MSRQPRLTANFRWREVTHSAIAASQGYDNAPGRELFDNVQYTAEQLQLIRARTGKLDVSSWYRSPEVQLYLYQQSLAGLKGASLKAKRAKVLRSQHITGQAADVFSQRYSRMQLLEYVRKCVDAGLQFDQMITYDHGSKTKRRMVHLSFVQDDPRMEVLKSPEPGKYTRWRL